MVRIIVGSLLSAVALFIFGMLSWMVLGIHDGTVRPVPDPSALTAALQSQLSRTGVYSVPVPPEMPDATAAEKQAAMEACMAKRRQGPIYSIFYQAEGAEPFSPAMMGGGFAINFVCSLIAATMLWMAGPSLPTYFRRVQFVALFGVFAAVFRDVALFNWMYFPWDYTRAMIIDVLVAWVLAGLILGAIVKRPAPALVK